MAAAATYNSRPELAADGHAAGAEPGTARLAPQAEHVLGELVLGEPVRLGERGVGELLHVLVLLLGEVVGRVLGGAAATAQAAAAVGLGYQVAHALLATGGVVFCKNTTEI